MTLIIPQPILDLLLNVAIGGAFGAVIALLAWPLLSRWLP